MSRLGPFWLGASAALALASSPGCSGSPDPRAGAASFEEIAEEARRIALEDSEVALIGNLRAMAPRPNGNILVVDPMTHRVLEFDARGRLVRWVGRPGDGPGELRSPHGIALLEDGRALVAGATRLTLLSPELAFQDNLNLEVSSLFSGVYRLEDRTVLGLANHREDGHAFAFLDVESGRVTNPFVRRHPLLLTVPYWNAFFHTYLAGFRGGFVAANNMVYPLLILDEHGTQIDSLDTPPASWKEAPRPERGEFAMAPWSVMEEWQRGFTLVEGVFAIQDRWLAVPHRVFREGSPDPVYLLDLYDQDLRKRHTDLLLPGKPILGGECLWLLTAEPPQPWTLSCFALR